jgi:hypothetical protein
LIEPNGTEIYFVKRFSHQTGGTLDVDMNISAGNARRDAVENIAYKKIPPDGVYTVVVDNYNRREQIDVGCSIQVEFEGQIQNFHLDKVIGRGHEFLSISIKGSKLEAIRVLDKRITCAESSREIWGIQTEKLTRVSSVMLSPNHWDGKEAGARHVFFMLEGCKNPEPARGLYNEFLSPKIEKHRKVFEVLGDKIKCEVVDDQLSGVGFSPAKNESLVVVAQGHKFNKTYEVLF